MSDDDLIEQHCRHLAATKSPETIKARRDLLRRLERHLPFGLLFAAPEQLEAWLAGMRERGLARATVSISAYHARSFYAWATKSGFRGTDPMVDMEKPRAPRGVPHPVSEAELAAALTLAEPYRTAVILAAFAGLRRSEIAACKREHITAELIMIPSGKGDEPGAVPTHPYLWEHVRARSSGFLVLQRSGQPVDGHWISKHARYAFDAIGLGHVSMHDLRHRYGTLIQELYGDIRVTQECLRHKSITSTQIYTQVTGARRAAAVAVLPVPGAPHTPDVVGVGVRS